MYNIVSWSQHKCDHSDTNPSYLYLAELYVVMSRALPDGRSSSQFPSMQYLMTYYLGDLKSTEPAAATEGAMLLIGVGAGLTLMVLRGCLRAIRWGVPRLWQRVRQRHATAPSPPPSGRMAQDPASRENQVPLGMFLHPPPASVPDPRVWPHAVANGHWPRVGSGGHDAWGPRRPLHEIWRPLHVSTPGGCPRATASTSVGPGASSASLDRDVVRSRGGGETSRAGGSDTTVYYTE